MASNDDNTDKLMKSVGELEFSFKNYAPAVCLLVNEDQSFFHGNSLSYQGLGVYAKDKNSYGKAYNPLVGSINQTNTVWPVGTVFAISENRFITTYSAITKINNEASEYAEPSDDADAENHPSSSDIIMSKLRVVSGFYECNEEKAESKSDGDEQKEKYSWQILKVKSITRILSYGLAIIETENALATPICYPVAASKEDIRAIRVDDELVSLNYALGQTLQWSHGEMANFNTEELTTFEAAINAYPGSEGAPVFDKKSGRLLGILLEGNESPIFVQDPPVEPSTPTDNDKAAPPYHFAPLKFSELKPHKVAWISNVISLKAK